MDKNSLRNNGNETVFHRQDLFIDCMQYHQSWEKYSSIFESVILFWETKKKKKTFYFELHIIERQTFSIVINIDPEICNKIQKRREILVECGTIVTSYYTFACFPLYISFSSLYQNIIIVN